MRYAQFKNRCLHLPFIVSRDIAGFKKSGKQVLHNQLRRWQAKGLIIKLKRGIYIFNANDRKVNPSRQFFANQLYSPSYVSLEYALNFYGLIPERVIEVTSVTTKKTMQFKNALGTFSYQHIKPEAFRGFRAAKENNDLIFFIAEPEKAIADFLYLNLNRFKLADKDIFRSSYRFQNAESLNRKKILKFTGLFRNKKLSRIAGLFCEFVKEEKGR